MSTKRKVGIGDFVTTIHGVDGIITQIKPKGDYGTVIFIATSDMRIFYCPATDLINCEIIIEK